MARATVPRGIRNMLRSPAKSAAWAWDELKYAAGVRDQVCIREGWSLLCHPVVYRGAYHAQVTDPEQVDEFDGFVASCRPGMVLFDLGAHFGLFSLAALHYGGARALAVAVDPSPVAHRIQRIQARLNRVDDRLHSVRAAVGDHVGWLGLVAAGVIADGYFVPPAADHAPGETTRTPATTIDRLVQDFGLRPTHIKIDVEGNEAAVLRGGRDLLSRAEAPLLFIELHNRMVRERHCDAGTALDLVEGFGYEVAAPNGTPLRRQTILEKPLVRVIAAKPLGNAGLKVQL